MLQYHFFFEDMFVQVPAPVSKSTADPGLGCCEVTSKSGMKRSDFHCHEAFGKFDIATEDASMHVEYVPTYHTYHHI